MVQLQLNDTLGPIDTDNNSIAGYRNKVVDPPGHPRNGQLLPSRVTHLPAG